MLGIMVKVSFAVLLAVGIMIWAYRIILKMDKTTEERDVEQHGHVIKHERKTKR